MRGVETLLLANDACNYPINRRFCFIGNFFDGKLFQLKLGQCRAGLSLLDICDGKTGHDSNDFVLFGMFCNNSSLKFVIARTKF